MHDAYVELVGLCKSFGAVAAVSNIDLAIPEGKMMTLLGPSGCGKTTILRLIAGFIRPDEGEIRIKDQRVNEIPHSDATPSSFFRIMRCSRISPCSRMWRMGYGVGG